MEIKVILGIGNPGQKYRKTRHNLGFLVLDAIVENWKLQYESSRFKALIAQTTYQDSKIILVKPLTYVNCSGESAIAVLNWYKIVPQNLLVVVDDLNLPLGKIRMRKKGSSGGHKGLDSIIRSLGTSQFPRLRIGIDQDERIPISHYVLSTFPREELDIIQESIKQAHQIALSWTQEKEQKVDSSNILEC